jgi:hypothetical protein
MPARRRAGAPRAAVADAERVRLAEDARREKNWKRWGPYLAERQWGTIREDYSADGDCWTFFPHDHARSRAYRWGEDGLLGITDRECRLAFALALWNGRDPILKERLFGLSNHEGNHGEDVKECYFYLDATPTHSYMKALYRYPQAEFPYARLVEENRRRTRQDPEFEILDTGLFDDGRYFDIIVEYAKEAPEDILIRITAANRGPEAATLHLLPTLWFRNTWSWGAAQEEGDSGALGAEPPALERIGPPHRPDGSASGARGSGPHALEVGGQSPLLDGAASGARRGGGGPSGAARAGESARPSIERDGDGRLVARHGTLGTFALHAEALDGISPELLFTENETNTARLFGVPLAQPCVKDGFHEYVVEGRREAVSLRGAGTKAAALYRLDLAAGGEAVVRLRLRVDAGPGAGPVGSGPGSEPFGASFDATFAARREEADRFYDALAPALATEEERRVMRQGYAGLLWSKQFYHYVVEDWLRGDPAGPRPPQARWHGRNHEWRHLYNRDVISMPDAWEYPWYAAWDTAFHMIPMARIDPVFAKDQLVLFLREWYMHPNGQIPAYEFNLGDVNPPVHAWAAWRVYKMTGARGERDRVFLERVFQKLVMNFTWWVNRKDAEGNNLFSGGFLGLDNIGVFDRSKPLPRGGVLEQADGTAWMAFYCSTMLSMALELARVEPVYEDMASKFFEHFVRISDAINTVGRDGLWDEEDGFYYDQLRIDGRQIPLRVRSMVGLIPLFACEIIEDSELLRLHGFGKRLRWFLDHRGDLVHTISYMARSEQPHGGRRLLAIPAKERLLRVLRYVLDESEFLSPYGIRSLSAVHRRDPYVLRADGAEYRVEYAPGDSNSALFGGNSNWRGPVWFPVNFLLIEALERYHHFYGDDLRVEMPTGSGRLATLKEVACELARRLGDLFLASRDGRRPFAGDDRRFDTDPRWRDLLLFHEFFHGDTGRGLGASHQTGWTALAVSCLEDTCRARTRAAARAASPR